MQQCMENYLGIAGESTGAKLAHIVLHAERGITRAELASLTGYSKSTVSLHVDSLLSMGMFMEETEDNSEKKHRNIRIKVNKDHGYIAAVEFGITSRNVAICNIDGEPLISENLEGVDNNLPPEQVLDGVASKLTELLSRLDRPDKPIIGVGVGVPAPMDFAKGTPICPPYLRMWDEFPVKGYLEERLGTRAFVDNDVNIMALAEYWKGSAQNCPDFLFIKLGTGIGCGIFCNGGIYRGRNGCAGDIGHIPVAGCERVCSCGNRGCLETIAGAPAIAAHMQRLAEERKSDYLASRMDDGERITCPMVNEAISRLDMESIGYIRSVGKSIGEVVSKLVNFYNPSKIVFGGGVSNFGDTILTPVKEAVYGSSSALATRNIKIIRSRLGKDCGIIGAALLVREEYFRPSVFSKEIIRNHARSGMDAGMDPEE